MANTAIQKIGPSDGRKIELVATGLPYLRGVPLAIDVRMVSPLHAHGTPFQRASTEPGTAIRRAIRDKHRTYPELVDCPTLKLIVVAMETGEIPS